SSRIVGWRPCSRADTCVRCVPMAAATSYCFKPRMPRRRATRRPNSSVNVGIALLSGKGLLYPTIVLYQHLSCKLRNFSYELSTCLFQTRGVSASNGVDCAAKTSFRMSLVEGARATRARGVFRTARNCDRSECPTSHDGSQARGVAWVDVWPRRNAA